MRFLPRIIAPGNQLVMPVGTRLPNAESKRLFEFRAHAPRVIDLSGTLQINMLEFMGSARKHILRFKLMREVIQERTAITARFDFDNDVVSISAHVKRMAIRLLTRGNQLRLWEEDVSPQRSERSVCESVAGGPPGGREHGSSKMPNSPTNAKSKALFSPHAIMKSSFRTTT